MLNCESFFAERRPACGILDMEQDRGHERESVPTTCARLPQARGRMPRFLRAGRVDRARRRVHADGRTARAGRATFPPEFPHRRGVASAAITVSLEGTAVRPRLSEDRSV